MTVGANYRVTGQRDSVIRDNEWMLKNPKLRMPSWHSSRIIVDFFGLYSRSNCRLQNHGWVLGF